MTQKIRNPQKSRKDEEIGGGYFVFRRGSRTGRVMPSPWPFEHPTIWSATREADKLAAMKPGYQFDVLEVCYSACAEAEE